MVHLHAIVGAFVAGELDRPRAIVLSYSREVEVMRYAVLLEPIHEPGLEGYYYAHIPTLDLTTHGRGVDGALAAARELAEAWVAEKRAHGELVPAEATALLGHIDLPDAVLTP